MRAKIPNMQRPETRSLSIVMALLLALLQPGCRENQDQPGGRAEASTTPRLIILISLDTLRADHLSLYGHHRFTSPILNDFAAQGTVFDDASSTSPWTLPAHASLLTGLTPRSHRVLTFDTGLPDSVPTLAAILDQHGYRTAAVVNSAWLRKKRYRLTRDFEKYLFVDDTQKRRAPNTWITDQALTWIRDRGENDLFLFVHYYDAHSDYSSLPEYERLFLTPYEGEADGTGWQLSRASFEDDYVEMCHENFDPLKCRIGTPQNYLAVDRSVGKIHFDADDLRHIEELYDAGIRQLDTELGRFLSLLEVEGVLDDALILITSDHGEEFMDHGRMDHFLTMYQEVLRVPMILRGPGIPRGLRIDTPVSVIDVVPTLLEWAGLEAPAATEGLSLMGLMEGDSSQDVFEKRLLFGEASGGLTYAALMEGIYPVYRSIRRGDHKLIHDSKEENWALYDLKRDPGEKQDIGALQPKILAGLKLEMRERYEDFRPDPAAADRVEVDREELERLRALGYVP